MFLEFEVVWGLLLTLLLADLFGMGLHGFGSLDFVAASRSDGRQAKLCCDFQSKKFSHSLISARLGAIKALQVFNYPRISYTIVSMVHNWSECVTGAGAASPGWNRRLGDRNLLFCASLALRPWGYRLDWFVASWTLGAGGAGAE